MKREIRSWLSAIGPESLRKIGVREGQAVLDFGSGPGYYALPAVRIVGKSGRVVAIEKNALTALRARRRLMGTGIAHVHQAELHNGTALPLDADSVDITLAFDVLLPCYFDKTQMPHVLNEISRIIKPDGTLAVYPSHIPIEHLLPYIEGAGFGDRRRVNLPLLHFGGLVDGIVFLFTKKLEP